MFLPRLSLLYISQVCIPRSLRVIHRFTPMPGPDCKALSLLAYHPEPSMPSPEVLVSQALQVGINHRGIALKPIIHLWMMFILGFHGLGKHSHSWRGKHVLLHVCSTFLDPCFLIYLVSVVLGATLPSGDSNRGTYQKQEASGSFNFYFQWIESIYYDKFIFM